MCCTAVQLINCGNIKKKKLQLEYSVNDFNFFILHVFWRVHAIHTQWTYDLIEADIKALFPFILNLFSCICLYWCCLINKIRKGKASFFMCLVVGKSYRIISQCPKIVKYLCCTQKSHPVSQMVSPGAHTYY